MFATLLAALAVVIALQALRLASRDRIVIQVQPESGLSVSQSLELPPFLNKSRSSERAQTPERLERSEREEQPVSFQQGSPLDVHPN